MTIKTTFKWLWRIIFGGTLIAGAVVGTLYVRAIVWPAKGALDTQPVGVSKDLNRNQAPKPTLTDNALVTAVILKPMVAAAIVSSDFSQAAAFEISLQDATGRGVTADSRMTITLSSTGLTGQFDATTAAVIAAGKSSLLVRYRDSVAGTATITAFVSGLTGSSVKLTLNADRAVGLDEISPVLKNPLAGQETVYAVVLQDRFGNAASGEVVWSLVDPTSTKRPLSISQTDVTGRSRLSFTPPADLVGMKATLQAGFGQVTRSLALQL